MAQVCWQTDARNRTKALPPKPSHRTSAVLQGSLACRMTLRQRHGGGLCNTPQPLWCSLSSLLRSPARDDVQHVQQLERRWRVFDHGSTCMNHGNAPFATDLAPGELLLGRGPDSLAQDSGARASARSLRRARPGYPVTWARRSPQASSCDLVTGPPQLARWLCWRSACPYHGRQPTEVARPPGATPADDGRRARLAGDVLSHSICSVSHLRHTAWRVRSHLICSARS